MYMIREIPSGEKKKEKKEKRKKERHTAYAHNFTLGIDFY